LLTNYTSDLWPIIDISGAPDSSCYLHNASVVRSPVCRPSPRSWLLKGKKVPTPSGLFFYTEGRRSKCLRNSC